MGHALDDLARHNTWATSQVLAYCRNLDETTMSTKIPGTYGTIMEMLRHIIDSEASYLFRLTGAWSEIPWKWEDPYDLDILTDRVALLSKAMDDYLAGDVDSERLGEARSDKKEVFAVPAGVFITQIFHHANEHRAQICSTLGTLGFEPPNVSGWGYGRDTGRSRLTHIED